MNLEEKVDEVLRLSKGLEKNAIGKMGMLLFGTLLTLASSLSVIAINHYLIAPSIVRETLTRERLDLRQEGLDQIRIVKASFEKICLFDLDKGLQNEMSVALEGLRKLTDKLEGYDEFEGPFKSLSAYNDFVAEAFHRINASEISATEKAGLITQGQTTYEYALRAINSLAK